MSDDTSNSAIPLGNKIESDNYKPHSNNNEDSTHNENKNEDSSNNTFDLNNKTDDSGSNEVKTEFNEDDNEILNLFLSEINNIGNIYQHINLNHCLDKLGKVEYDNKNIKLDANQVCLRLTSQTFSTPYQVLQLKHDATEEEIKQRYYKVLLFNHIIC